MNETTAKLGKQNRIKVGYVMHVMQVAGAEVLVKQIIERLSDSIEATVFCLDSLGKLGEELVDKGVSVVVLNRQPGLDFGVAKRLAMEVREKQIEVLHAHQYTPFFYTALARLRYGVQSKVIFTEHGRHYPDIVSWKRRLSNRLLLQRYADITTACCDFSTEALKTIEGFPKAYTLNNGVEIETLEPRGDHPAVLARRQALGLDPNRPYAASIARFHPVKDHATLIRAWARVHQQLPEARLLLVGDGEERDNIAQLIADLSNADLSKQYNSSDNNQTNGNPADSTLNDAIQFLGIRNDVPEILKAIDVFTLTSVSEAASLTLLEAMASECASVVTDVGGNAEHLREGIDGYLVPRADDKKLAERLVKLLSNPNKVKQMGQSAREQVCEKFDLNDAVEQYADLYQKLAS